jgi:hypothetical protein
MTTTATVTAIAEYERIAPGLGAIIKDTMIQSVDLTARGRMDALVLDVARVKAPRAAKEKKAPVTRTADALVGEDSYLRPNGDRYYARKWGEHSDVAVLRTARDSGHYVMMYGAPGTGKTAAIEAAFADTGLHTVLGSGDTEVADLIGGYVQTPSGAYLWEDGPLLKAAERGETLLVDEIGLIDTKVLSVLYGLMDGRREYTVTANPERGTVKAAPGFFVVAATNPNAPGVRHSAALLSRFALQVEMTTDWSLARKLGVPTQMVTVAQNLSKKQQANEVSWAPQMRELLAYRDIEKLFGTKFAVANLLASAPELDRPLVADVFARVTGEPCLPAKI